MSEGTITLAAPCGGIRGRVSEDGKTAFLGIPYGRADRFCLPEPMQWEGVKDCTGYAGRSLQPDRLGVYPAEAVPEVRGSEDCLNLNIWAPAAAEHERMPVVIYVHGGAFQVGSAQESARAGDRFMEEDRMVFVSVEYRLGVLGFLALGGEMGEKYRHSGCCGAMDVFLAVRWVHENIAAFGGDPERVTLMGISAGAKLIGSLLTIPAMKNLCSQVILESGAMQSFRSRKTARNVACGFEKRLGITDEKELLSLPAEQLVKEQAMFCSTPGSTCFFGPVMDPEIFDPEWKMALAAGWGWHGRAILGSSLREMGPMADSPQFPGIKETALRNLFGENASCAERAYEKLSEGESSDRWTKVLSDFMYRTYTDRLAAQLDEQNCPVWVYSFEVLPAVHGMGFAFVMGEWETRCAGMPKEEKDAYRRVSEAMRRSVRRFICTGVPEEETAWPRYQGRWKRIFDRSPHTEERPGDSLENLPDDVFRRSLPAE